MNVLQAPHDIREALTHSAFILLFIVWANLPAFALLLWVTKGLRSPYETQKHGILAAIFATLAALALSMGFPDAWAYSSTSAAAVFALTLAELEFKWLRSQCHLGQRRIQVGLGMVGAIGGTFTLTYVFFEYVLFAPWFLD